VDQINYIVTFLWVHNLSIPYYEIDNKVHTKSFKTELCQGIGVAKVFTDFMSMFYTFFIALLIKQIISNPIDKIRKYSIAYHVIAFLCSLTLTIVFVIADKFGVEVRKLY